MTKEEKRYELKKKRSVLAFATILVCILAVIAAVAAVLAGIMTFLLRHYAAR